MNYTLDFRSYRRPEIVLTMKDEEATILHVTTPTVQLTEEFKANLPELQKVLLSGDEDASRMVYHLGAKLMSCNLDAKVITGPELAHKYRLNLHDMAEFFLLYMDFIEDIQKAKN
jgi:stalled ribosome rescue protein Dom34